MIFHSYVKLPEGNTSPILPICKPGKVKDWTHQSVGDASAAPTASTVLAPEALRHLLEEARLLAAAASPAHILGNPLEINWILQKMARNDLNFILEFVYFRIFIGFDPSSE